MGLLLNLAEISSQLLIKEVHSQIHSLAIDFAFDLEFEFEVHIGPLPLNFSVRKSMFGTQGSNSNKSVSPMIRGPYLRI